MATIYNRPIGAIITNSVWLNKMLSIILATVSFSLQEQRWKESNDIQDRRTDRHGSSLSFSLFTYYDGTETVNGFLLAIPIWVWLNAHSSRFISFLNFFLIPFNFFFASFLFEWLFLLLLLGYFCATFFHCRRSFCHCLPSRPPFSFFFHGFRDSSVDLISRWTLFFLPLSTLDLHNLSCNYRKGDHHGPHGSSTTTCKAPSIVQTYVTPSIPRFNEKRDLSKEADKLKWSTPWCLPMTPLVMMIFLTTVWTHILSTRSSSPLAPLLGRLIHIWRLRRVEAEYFFSSAFETFFKRKDIVWNLTWFPPPLASFHFIPTCVLTLCRIHS